MHTSELVVRHHIVEPVTATRGPGWALLAKNILDRSTAALLLVVVLPMMIAIAIAVGVTSPGPILFRQQRVGLGGRRFECWKFRTMVQGADRLQDALLPENDCDGIIFKMRNDPRITPVGRWLRRFSLDELPQLFQVLLGHMSLVGPRPPLPSEVERYDARVARRLAVRPGLTGLWQVSGRSDLTWAESVEIDLAYVESWSLGLDARIMLRTLPAVVGGRGAY